MNFLHTVYCSIKARACDWAVERKGGTGGLGVGADREGEENERGGERLEEEEEEEEEAMMDLNHMARKNHK